jgi:hypothetical protein
MIKSRRRLPVKSVLVVVSEDLESPIHNHSGAFLRYGTLRIPLIPIHLRHDRHVHDVAAWLAFRPLSTRTPMAVENGYGRQIDSKKDLNMADNGATDNYC